MIHNYVIAGIKVFVTESCGTFVARRKHKKRRIKKKWLKRYGKIFEPCRALVVANLGGERVIFCHPKYWAKFNEKFEKFKVTSHIENIFSNNCTGCEYINDDGGYCYDCYNCSKKYVQGGGADG